MIQHPALDRWEKKLKAVLDELDDTLEEKFGKDYDLHPARPDRGKTANKAHDGLFDIVASFTLGTGSKYGRGYVIDVDMATLDHVPSDAQKKIDDFALKKLRETLPEHFPGTNLNVHKDGNVIKIHGDLSLGEL